jgi:hypothetical protein
MRIQLILIAFLLSTSLFASSDKEMAELFLKYDSIMNAQKVELIDEVFTQKFLKTVGGKEEFIESIKSLPKLDTKSIKFSKVKWRKGTKDEIFFAKRSQTSDLKSKEPAPATGPSFIVIKEDGKLKIDGTISDDH